MRTEAIGGASDGRPRRRARPALALLCATLLALAGGASAVAAEAPPQAAPCAGCHGAAGLPADPQVPIIWGQEFYYLYVQLKDYKAGRRANPVMSGIVQSLSKDEMRALAEYFAAQAWPGSTYRTPQESEARAARGLTAGQCVQCHLGGFEGNSRVPRLAGQQAEYLERTMAEFKNKVRLNSPAKGSLLAAYEDVDIAAMAQFLAGL